MTYLTLSPESARLAAEVQEWSVQEVRPFAREADRMHEIPDAAYKLADTCPIQETPWGGRVDYPRRGSADFDPAATDGPHYLGSALIESLYYGDAIASQLIGGGEGLASRVVRQIGTPEQIDRWIVPPRPGEYNRMAFAMTEPSAGGSDPGHLQTRARQVGDTWVLNGQKHFCSNGAISSLLCVFATIDPALGRQGIRAFVIPRDTPGLVVTKRNESKLGLRAMMTTEFVLENVELPLDSLVGHGQDDDVMQGLKVGLSALNSTRGYIASIAIGHAQASVDEGRAHLAGHRRFIAVHRARAIEGELGRMDAALDRCRQLTRRFAMLVDLGQPYRRAASVAKAYTCPLAERIIARVIAHMGTFGTSEESLVEKWHRDVKICDIYEGTGNIQRITLGRELRAPRSRRAESHGSG